MSAFYRWSDTRTHFTRWWGCFITKWKHIHLIHDQYFMFCFFKFLFFPLNQRKWSECAKWYVPVPGQSELSLQHHPGIPGFSSQLWHWESHGFKCHHQDPQPSLQRVSVHTPTCENQECWSGWTMLEPPASGKASAGSSWQSGVCEEPCRV